ncbi:16S rRNA (adenine(1518)-N(6)/adenine(1519)-N(6))-dimethyltransferase RsmA [Olsenella sp. Marseille-P4559]|uniref:16S rRNA (adenine(1518)-N(6)/adenine(1519)-N(6))- dimethyltransferase RsmA n=1 Tax=Olsenella sp. Marseille-P4559 TaxID=2364795 RepID=UPI00102F55FA|nr:16S rRNA (adenine(1518)-N(6)/adenine(1519)-N(6))-dimethyltransferase RsmA [Olsenella sp. Marseille-P4559]
MAYSKLANLRETHAVLEHFGLATKHRLGQNFLVDDSVIGHILELAELDPADAVLEVGPGIGTLTVAMLPRVGAVCAVEADRQLEPVLGETCAQDSDRLRLVMGDALKVIPDGLPFAPGKFVSNLPYQVAATLVLKVFSEVPSVQRAVVMVQAEVAERICAAPGSKAYGAYTAKLALLGRVTGRFEVGPGSFSPPPHVNSAVVRIDRAPLEGVPATAPAVIDAAFAQRRKTIRNSMVASGYERDALAAAFATCGIAPGVRAETLSPADFVRLAGALG